MTERRPLVQIAGRIKELPVGDTLPGDGGGGGAPVGGDIDGGNATTTYEGVPVFDFGSAT